MDLKISVVIPVYNEASILGNTLRKIHEHRPHEIIVVDGGSIDQTVVIAEARDAWVVHSVREKSVQMNAGAEKATGNVLWFLHADSEVKLEGYRSMERAVARSGCVGGAFTLRIDSHKKSLSFISSVANWRSKTLGLAYGDQGIFVRAEVFRAMGGFALLPICEDLDFFRRMKREGAVTILDEAAAVSPRRWLVEGAAYVTFRNFLIAGLFLMGFPPHWLSRWYGVIR